MTSLADRYKGVLAQLKEHGQSHVMAFWDELSDDARGELLDDLEQVDLQRVTPLIDELVRQAPAPEIPESIHPPTILPTDDEAENPKRYAAAVEHGGEAIAAGKVAAFVVAGGQGTRLGFDGPKGAFPVTPIREALLFQVFAEYLRGVERRYGRRPPWYIMTSPLNHAATVQLFEQHDYFGLVADDVRFFQQGQMPAFQPDGRLILDQKHRLALSPDGHGGSLTALARSGALADMRARGIEHISYFQVDNPLVKPIDPLFIGLHLETGSEMSSKAVRKANDLERVGNFCLADGKLTVIEYSDLPDELAKARTDSGERKFDAGSIAIHLLTVDFVERLTERTGYVELPWHRASKKVPFVDETGVRQTPTEPNAVKLEMFVFDALPLAKNPMVLYTRRDEEFSPVKNAEGVDSPETARRDQQRRAARWLESAGVTVPYDKNGEPATLLEISPAFAIDAADLRAQLKSAPAIKAGEPLLLA